MLGAIPPPIPPAVAMPPVPGLPNNMPGLQPPMGFPPIIPPFSMPPPGFPPFKAVICYYNTLIYILFFVMIINIR